MIKEKSRRLGARAAATVASLALLGMAAAEANAGCLDSAVKRVPSGKLEPTARYIQAVYHPADLGALLQPIADFHSDASIVGVWKFELTGFLNDFGTQAFHAGGTEMMFSAGVDPATGDVCQGVWRQVGPRAYTLNHIAMAWTAPGEQYGLLIHIHSAIRVSRDGNSLIGNYTVALYGESPDNPFDESGTPLVTGSGSMTATRLSPD